MHHLKQSSYFLFDQCHNIIISKWFVLFPKIRYQKRIPKLTDFNKISLIFFDQPKINIFLWYPPWSQIRGSDT